MEKEQKTSFGEKFDSFMQSEEVGISINLQALQTVFKIFEGNYQELLGWLEQYNSLKNSSIEDIAKLDLRVLHEQLHDPTLRLLHNFIASAQCFIEQMEVICNQLYTDDVLKSEFIEKRQREVYDKPISIFVKRFRNYILHYKLPMISLRISVEEGFELSMRLDIKELKKYKKWGGANVYLNSLAEDLCLATFAKEWYEIIQKFYTWLKTKHSTDYEIHFERLEKMQDDLWN